MIALMNTGAKQINKELRNRTQLLAEYNLVQPTCDTVVGWLFFSNI